MQPKSSIPLVPLFEMMLPAFAGQAANDSAGGRIQNLYAGCAVAKFYACLIDSNVIFYYLIAIRIAMDD